MPTKKKSVTKVKLSPFDKVKLALLKDAQTLVAKIGRAKTVNALDLASGLMPMRESTARLLDQLEFED